MQKQPLAPLTRSCGWRSSIEDWSGWKNREDRSVRTNKSRWASRRTKNFTETRWRNNTSPFLLLNFTRPWKFQRNSRHPPKKYLEFFPKRKTTEKIPESNRGSSLRRSVKLAIGDTVDGKGPAETPVEVGSLSHCLQGFFSTVPGGFLAGFLNHQQYLGGKTPPPKKNQPIGECWKRKAHTRWAPTSYK